MKFHGLVTVVVLGLLSEQALGQRTPAGFDEAYNKGQDAYNLGKYDEAFASFEKARDLDPSKPGPYRWLGRTARAMERWKECVANSTQAMRLNPTSQYAGDMRKDIDSCRAALGYPAYAGTIPDGQGALAVVANVEGAAVTVDGLKKGATPLQPIPLLPGKHQVHVERKGYLPVDVEVEVVATIVVDADVELAVDPAARTEGDPVDPTVTEVSEGWLVIAARPKPDWTMFYLDGKQVRPGADGSIAAEPGVHVLEVRAPLHDPWTRRVTIVRGQKRIVHADLVKTTDRRRNRAIGYTLLGTSMATLATGLVFGWLESEAADEAHDIRAVMDDAPGGFTPPPGSEEAELLMKDLADVEDRRDTYGLASKVSLGVAAVTLGASIYFLVNARDDGRPGREPPLAITPTVGPGSAGVVFTRELDW